jgi:hypothetical protein
MQVLASDQHLSDFETYIVEEAPHEIGERKRWTPSLIPASMHVRDRNVTDMTSPKISETSRGYYFTARPQDTCDLIAFLRQHTDGFSVDVAGPTLDPEDLADFFEFPKDTDSTALAGLLATFYADRN